MERAHPWCAIGMWVVFVAVCFAAGGWAGTNEATSADMAVGESGRAATIVDDGDFADHPEENVLVTARPGGSIRPRGRRPTDAARRLAALDEVEEVGDPVPSRDGTALLVPVTMADGPDGPAGAGGRVGAPRHDRGRAARPPGRAC